MQLHKTLNGLIVTGTAAFVGTNVDVEVDAGSLGKVFGAHVMPIGTAAIGNAVTFQLKHALAAGGDYVSPDATGKVTFTRKIEGGGTNAALTFQYTLIGY